MRKFASFAFAIVAATLLAGCGGASVPHGIDNVTSDSGSPKHYKTFTYTGSKQRFVVPKGVTQLAIVARGAEGGGIASGRYSFPSNPGRVYAVIRSHPDDTLYVFVGGRNGFNGGGSGGTSSPSSRGFGASGGGGASDVRMGGDALKDRIIVAAGGGGGGGGNHYARCSGGERPQVPHVDRLEVARRRSRCLRMELI